MEADLPGVLGSLAWTLAGLFLVIVLLLCYRMVAQFTGSAEAGGLLGLLYAASAPFVAPFRDFETVTPVRDSSIFEFATLLAIEAVLFVGLFSVAGLAIAAALAQRYAPWSWSREMDLEPVVETWHDLPPSLAGVAADADRAAAAATRALAGAWRSASASPLWGGLKSDTAALGRAARSRMAGLSLAGGQGQIEGELNRLPDFKLRETSSNRAARRREHRA